MVMLDQIIRTLSLTFLDADEPNVSVFSRREVPQIHPEHKQAQKTLWHGPSHSADDNLQEDPIRATESHKTHHSQRESNPLTQIERCSCVAMSLGQRWAAAFEHTPLWLSTPAWDENWTEAEIRKESCRRLCWSSVILAAGHSSYTTAYKTNGLDLFITEPANVSRVD
jgi:hypothetical protein